MIEGLSEETQGLFALAADQSARLKHYYLGVEHVFLACAQLDRQALSEALNASGVSLDKVMNQLHRRGGFLSRCVRPYLPYTVK